MKKAIIMSLVALSGFSAIPAMAAVDQSTYRFECPNASGGTPSERLTNYGTYIRGMGEANTTNNKILPLFKGVPGAGVPLNLSGYSHAGTQYNPSTGRITCFYTHAVNPAFDVSYISLNSKQGWVVKSDNSAITIRVLAG
ncbi:MAG TPA: hypothetical protein DDY37_07485 [Legionella sp.]|nr:hypothetical protein [Legionella sp.]